MKVRYYMLKKEVPHPKAKDATTPVYFIGWVPVGGKMTPMMGPPHEIGTRNAVLFPTQSIVQQALDDMSLEFKVGLVVVDALVEEV